MANALYNIISLSAHLLTLAIVSCWISKASALALHLVPRWLRVVHRIMIAIRKELAAHRHPHAISCVVGLALKPDVEVG
jgi:hypothetical protein